MLQMLVPAAALHTPDATLQAAQPQPSLVHITPRVVRSQGKTDIIKLDILPPQLTPQVL